MSPLKIRFKGNPLAAVVIVLALSWFVLEMVVGFDDMRDRHVGDEGTVVEIKTTWIDRYTSMEVRMHQRIEPGDHVVKERGFGNDPQVPGKPTVSEMLEEHRRR